MAGTRDTLGALSYCPACARVQVLGAGKFGGKGGRRSPGSPAHQPPHRTPRDPEAGKLGVSRVPGPGPVVCRGVLPEPRGLRVPAAGTRIRGALWTPGVRGPGLHTGLGQGASGCALLAAALGLGRASGSHTVNLERVRAQGCGGVGGTRPSPPILLPASGRGLQSPSSELPEPCSGRGWIWGLPLTSLENL